MPINNWNFYRAVSVGTDHKSWLSDNPQVEDGRIGGNQEFDSEVTDQYQYEVNHMMRRLRLNFYRAEDAFLILKKQQWAKEDKEFRKQQEERKRKARNKRVLRNKQRRERKELELRSRSLPSLNNFYEPDEDQSFDRKHLENNFLCKGCKTLMKRGHNIYQCHDGHIICEVCIASIKDCVECGEPIVGRNYTMERLGLLVLDMDVQSPTAPSLEDRINLTEISESSV